MYKNFNETDIERCYQQEIQQKMQRKPPSNDTEEEWTCITDFNYISPRHNERNEERHGHKCREVIEEKRKARLKCTQCSTRANQNYNRKRIAAARVCRRKKRELLRTKVDESLEHHSKNESEKCYKRIQEITQEFKPRVNACRDAGGRMLTEKEHIQRWKEYLENVLAANPNET